MTSESPSEESFKKDVLHDFWVCLISREASILGRKEVLNGRAKFGILGDGKEVPQVAMARAFKKGDWRSGYYRDMTFMFARGLCTVEEFFLQLYADAENDPFSGGRQMNCHFATPLIDQKGEWLDHAHLYNVSSDISCTAGQMARALGLAMASRKYRELDIENGEKFSNNGNEVSFVTIGDSSTSEGIFWETMNASAVLKVPMLVAVWDDGYGISVPVEMQTVKGSISKALEGFLIDENGEGILIYTVKGWDYPELCAAFEKVSMKVRKNHIPAVIHVQELTQPQGHSTSGSHERYKSPDRLHWEKENDCIKRMGEWIIENNLATEAQLEEMRVKAKDFVKQEKTSAWQKHKSGIRVYFNQLNDIYNAVPDSLKTEAIKQLQYDFEQMLHPEYSEIVSNAKRLKYQLMRFGTFENDALEAFIEHSKVLSEKRYHTHLYS